MTFIEQVKATGTKVIVNNPKASAVVVVGIPSAIMMASVATSTTVVLGAVAAPGAIKTLTVMINGKTAVYSLIKASMLSKVIGIGLIVVAASVIGYGIYKVITHKSKQ